MRCLEDGPESLILGLPDTFGLDWVSNHYRHVIEEELAKFSGQTQLELRLAPVASVAPITTTSTPPTDSAAITVSDRPAPGLSVVAPEMETSERYTFQSFVTGPSNELAAAAAQSVANNPGGGYNPLFVFGRVGLGKTHLIRAIGYEVKRRSPEKRVQYQTTEQFVNDVVQCIRFERMDQVRAQYRACDVLVIDDIQFIACKAAFQAEFFHTFNALYHSDKQIVVTSDVYPQNLPAMEERLLSRFQSGMVADIQPPEVDTRVAILRKKAEAERIALSDDVAHFIAQVVKSNVRELEGTLLRIAVKGELLGRSIDLDLAKESLRAHIPVQEQALTVEDIQKAVCAYFGLKLTELKSKRRHRAVSYPRQVAMYLCRQRLGTSYPELGGRCGGKDHPTVSGAVRKSTGLLESDDEKTVSVVQAIDRKLG